MSSSHVSERVSMGLHLLDRPAVVGGGRLPYFLSLVVAVAALVVLIVVVRFSWPAWCPP